MIAPRVPLLVALFLGACAVACGATPGDPSSSESDGVRIRPGGTELLARLTVRLPTGACFGNAGSCAAPLFYSVPLSLDGVALSLDTETRVLPGSHTLKIGPDAMPLVLAPGASRTVTLAVARRDCAGAPPPGDFGFVPDETCPRGSVAGVPFVRWRDVSFLGGSELYWRGCDYVASSYRWLRLPGTDFDLTDPSSIRSACEAVQSGDCGALVRFYGPSYRERCVAEREEIWAAFAPGRHTFAVGPAFVQHTLAEGEVRALPFALPALPTADVTLRFADARELPDAAPTRIRSGCGGDFVVPPGSGTRTLRAYADVGCPYTLELPGRPEARAIASPGVTDVTLHRVDVDHVAVTREDGSVFEAQGTYVLSTPGQPNIGPYPTGTGVDVLPGAYDVVVRYTTALGAQEHREHVIF